MERYGIRMKRRGKDKNCIRDQRGFTLVELLIGVVILSIVTAAVCSFIVIGSRSYAAANTEIMLQQEAQLAMNQISDVLIDTTRSVNYAGYDESGSPVLAVKDADFTFEPKDKSLTMFNGAGTIKLDADGKPIQAINEDGSLKVDSDGNPVYEMNIESGSGNDKNYQFYWNKDDARLYYSEIDVSQTDFPQNTAEGQVVLAEYVTEFSVDLTQVEEKRVVQISMTFERDNKTYHTSNNITIRNKVRINDVDLDKLDKRVKLSVTPKENSVILEPGEQYHFSTPLVSGQNVMDKSVTWSLSGDSMPLDSGTQFIDTANGIIQIASGEKATSFEVLITTNAKDSEEKQATAKVVVYVKRAETVALSLDGGSKEIAAGTNFKINASVEGNKLGVACGGCTDPTTEDKYVVAGEYPTHPEYSWQVISGAEYVDLVSYDNKSADFKINASAKAGDTVVIQAASLLSARKGYDNGNGIVYGTITLTVKESAKIHIDWDGVMMYGHDDNIVNAVGINSDDPVFLVCVRIKEDPNQSADKDMVMIYTTEGNNARLKPDTWLLNLNQEYAISIQIINILSDPALRDANNNKTPEYDELRRALSSWSGSPNSWQGQNPSGWAYDYLKNYVDTVFWPEYESRVNPVTGAYSGEKYPEYSNIQTGTLEKPRVGIVSYLDGKTYYDGVDAKTIYTVQKYNDLFRGITCTMGTVTSTWGSANYQNQAYYNVYKGNSEDSSQREKFYYSPENDQAPGQVSPYEGTGNIGDVILLKDSNLANHASANVLLDFDHTRGDKSNNHYYDKKKTTVGTYHYAPVFPYVNKPAGVYLKISENYKRYEGKQYCYDFNSTFNFEVKDGGNLTLWAYTDDGFKKGQIFFPVPSDTLQFPKEFRDLGADEVSISYYDGTYLLDQEGKLHEPKFSEIKCRYNAAMNRYELKLYYDYTDDTWGVAKKCYAGTYICEPDGEEWRFFDGGTYDSNLEQGKTIKVDASNAWVEITDGYGNLQTVKAYIPLPSSKEFTQKWWGGYGFELEQEGTQVCQVDGASIKCQINTEVKWFSCPQIICNYDKSTDMYTLQIVTMHKEWNGYQDVEKTDTIKVTCKSTDNQWTLVK